jgi:hypothetical protein
MISPQVNAVKSFIMSELTVNSGYKLESACGNYIYHLGIIDYLQKYDAWKKGERVFKVVKISLGSDKMRPDDISCVEPVRYRQRFLEFISKVVFRNYYE